MLMLGLCESTKKEVVDTSPSLIVQRGGRKVPRKKRKAPAKSKARGGLGRWFAEKWVDVKTGKPCGRSGKKDKRKGYPACRPSKRVSSKTPKTTKEMSSTEKRRFKKAKTSSKKISYQHRRKKKTTRTKKK
jgi:hypothetical protein